jgi:hypothetical protein
MVEHHPGIQGRVTEKAAETFSVGVFFFMFEGTVAVIQGVNVLPEFRGGRRYGYIDVFLNGPQLGPGRRKPGNRNPHLETLLAARTVVPVKMFAAAAETVIEQNFIEVFGTGAGRKKLSFPDTVRQVRTGTALGFV